MLGNKTIFHNDISIHALREESDTSVATRSACSIFQSTLSVRRATYDKDATDVFTVISIHALREESDNAPWSQPTHGLISIHALREESDLSLDKLRSPMDLFQSTLSVRRATVQLDISVRFLRRKPAA